MPLSAITMNRIRDTVSVKCSTQHWTDIALDRSAIRPVSFRVCPMLFWW